MPNNPASIEEALSYTGIFLERAVSEVIKGLDDYKVAREFPYTLQKYANEVIDGTIDIVAVKQLRHCNVCFVIECKRAYGEFRKWVVESDKDLLRDNFPWIYYVGQPGPLQKVDYGGTLILPALYYNHEGDYERGIHIFEYNAHNVSNPRSEEKVQGALRHINEAVAGLVKEPNKILQFIGNNNTPTFFLPVIVTTASLQAAKYSRHNVSIETGTVNAADIQLEDKLRVEYIYSVPEYARIKGFIDTRMNILPDKRATYIVNSGSLQAFIEGFEADLATHFDG
jgi:hypothetical protein